MTGRHILQTITDVDNKNSKVHPKIHQNTKLKALQLRKLSTLTQKKVDFKNLKLVPIVSLLTISGPFNSLFKVLFIFPSRYLFAIGLSPIFSFR